MPTLRCVVYRLKTRKNITVCTNRKTEKILGNENNYMVKRIGENSMNTIENTDRRTEKRLMNEDGNNTTSRRNKSKRHNNEMDGDNKDIE